MPRPTRSGLKVLAVGMVIMAPVLYVLSSGPVTGMVYRGQLRLETFSAIYKPLYWASYIRPVDDAIQWYWSNWYPEDDHTQPSA
jgi:hypothetical protein